MNVKSVEKENGKAKVVVEIDKAEFEQALNKAYAKCRKDIMLPGFRKGKAPREMVESMYGATVFYEDAVNEIFPDIYTKAIVEQELKAVGSPSVSNMDTPDKGGVVLTIETELYPEVTLGQYKGLEVPKREVKVEESEVDAEVNRMAERNARIETVDRAAANGDTVVIDFEGFVDDKPFQGGKAEDYSLTLGSGSFIPGFEDALVGAVAGEERDVNVTFPEDYSAKELAGKPAVFKCKVHEVKEAAANLDADLIIFDNALSPSQARNLNLEIGLPILDRTALILEIFQSRARSREAKLQVELARLQYLLPRLSGMGTAMSRQGGGSGSRSNKGAGEKKLELDRRHISHRITECKKELQTIKKQRVTQRKSRNASQIPSVALVGYTNVGKSTLMNQLSKSDVFAENKLFATLDTTVRKVIVDNLPFLLSDTVGFIRKLPTELVESFKSTLDEVREADLLVHVVDISHPTFEEQIEVVNRTLSEIDKAEKPMIMVFNKIDAFTFVPKDEDDLTPRTRENIDLDELKRTWMNKMQDNCIFISAKERTNIDALKALLYERVKQIHITRFPYNDFLFQQYDEE